MKYVIRAMALGLVVLHCLIARAVVPDVLMEPAPPGIYATATNRNLAAANYIEREVFMSGTARSFKPLGVWGPNGIWKTAVMASQPYKTRILTRFPADPAKFNGTVVVEWFNVTPGTDLDMQFAYIAEEVLSQGYAWVGVTSQQRGLAGLKKTYAERYKSLNLVNDDFSFDIYSQAAQAVRKQSAAFLGVPNVDKVIGTGLSQGAQLLVTYVNAVSPDAQVIDGFIIHGRPMAGFNTSGQQLISLPPIARIRTDLSTPVLQFEAESDVSNLLFALARQPDTDKVRTWEIAGASHIDARLAAYADAVLAADIGRVPLNCPSANALPTFRAAKAALRAMNDWVRTGKPAPKGDPLAYAVVILRDFSGFALGGVRLPEFEVPVTKFSQLSLTTPVGQPGFLNIFLCTAAGYTSPLSDAAIRARYTSRADYLKKIGNAASALVEAGFMVPGDELKTVQEAAARTLPLN
jgi:hypothetical protein